MSNRLTQKEQQKEKAQEFSELVGSQISAMLEDRGLTVADLVRKMGNAITRGVMGDLIRGTRQFRLAHLVYIAEALDLEPWELLRPASSSEHEPDSSGIGDLHGCPEWFLKSVKMPLKDWKSLEQVSALYLNGNAEQLSMRAIHRAKSLVLAYGVSYEQMLLADSFEQLCALCRMAEASGHATAVHTALFSTRLREMIEARTAPDVILEHVDTPPEVEPKFSYNSLVRAADLSPPFRHAMRETLKSSRFSDYKPATVQLSKDDIPFRPIGLDEVFEENGQSESVKMAEELLRALQLMQSMTKKPTPEDD